MKVLKFFSPTCGPCMALEQNLKNAKVEYESKDVMDEANEELMNKFGIRNIPTLVICDDEYQEFMKKSGLLSVTDINEFVNQGKEKFNA